jgi:membrane associated rhomboid family serine protease
VPAVVLSIIAFLVLIEAGREWLLTDEENIDFLLHFAFIPARYTESYPGGLGARIWTFLTYALLHANFEHVGVNSIWFLPFGSAMARRFGTWRFLAFCAVTAIAGAALHLVTHLGEPLPMIGASATVSGVMAGSLRFAFQSGGPLAVFRSHADAAYRVPAATKPPIWACHATLCSMPGKLDAPMPNSRLSPNQATRKMMMRGSLSAPASDAAGTR